MTAYTALLQSLLIFKKSKHNGAGLHVTQLVKCTGY